MISSSHIKNTFTQAFIYSSSGLIGKAVGFVMLPIYAHYLQAEGYGILGMIDVVLSVLTVIIGYGITGAMSRFYYETHDVHQRKIIVSTTIILMFILLSVLCLPAILIREQIGALAFGRNDLGYYIFIALLAFIAEITGQNAENYILIRQQAIYLSALLLFKLFLALSLNIYFIIYQQLGVLGFLYAALISNSLYTLVVHINAFLNVGISYNHGVAKKVLAFSLPLLPGYVAMFFRTNADKVILRAYLGLAVVGVYQMLIKFCNLLNLFAVEPFTKIWQVKRFEVCELENGSSILARVFTYHMGILFFFALILSLEIPVFLRILTPQEFWLSGFIVFFAVISKVFHAAYYHFFFGLLYEKKTFKISILQIISASLSLAITVPMVWAYGLVGAVIALTLSMGFQCAIAYFMARRYYRVPFDWGSIGRMTTLLVGMYWFAKDFTIVGTRIDLWLDANILPWVIKATSLLMLNEIKNGEIVLYLVKGLPHMVDSFLLFFYSFLFIAGLVCLKIFPLHVIMSIFKRGAFRNVTPSPSAT